MLDKSVYVVCIQYNRTYDYLRVVTVPLTAMECLFSLLVENVFLVTSELQQPVPLLVLLLLRILWRHILAHREQTNTSFAIRVGAVAH